MKMRAWFFLAITTLLAPSAAWTAESDDLIAIKALLQQYRATQDAGDLIAQAKLMTPDRVWINQSGTRRTDNVENMRYQQAAADAQKKRAPGTSKELMEEYGTGGAETGTLVLEKQKDGEWKIVHTHWSGL